MAEKRVKKKAEDKVNEGMTAKITRYCISILLAFLVYFFLGESYQVDYLSRMVMALIFCALSVYHWKSGFFHFFIFALTSIFTFISIEISFDFYAWILFIVSLAAASIVTWIYNKKRSDGVYAQLLLGIFIFLWIILAFNVTYRYDWFMENLLNVPFVILLVVLSNWFRLSKLSYSCIFLFMVMNIIGSHYTYSEVPFGFWIQNFFSLTRNHYDRIVHFSFGLLFAYPIREVFIRIGNSKGFWALWTPIELVLGLSAIYELLEWGIAVMFGGDLGIAYLGTQGDVWDAQKDMFLAGIGSIVAMCTVFIVLISFKKKEYWVEFKESLRVHKKSPLGEKALEKISK